MCICMYVDICIYIYIYIYDNNILVEAADGEEVVQGEDAVRVHAQDVLLAGGHGLRVHHHLDYYVYNICRIPNHDTHQTCNWFASGSDKRIIYIYIYTHICIYI